MCKYQSVKYKALDNAFRLVQSAATLIGYLMGHDQDLLPT